MTQVEWEPVGWVGFATPNVAILLLDAAERHLSKANELRGDLPGHVVEVVSPDPKRNRMIRNEDLLFDFFEDAIAGVVLAHSALDNFASDAIPEHFAMNVDGRGPLNRKQLQHRGIELRLSPVLAAALGRPNLRTADAKLWDDLMRLEALRDDIPHVRGSTLHTSATASDSVFARLLGEPDLRGFTRCVSRAIEHYSVDQSSSDVELS